jgi:hypothetical protein
MDVANECWPTRTLQRGVYNRQASWSFGMPHDWVHEETVPQQVDVQAKTHHHKIKCADAEKR